MARVEIEDDTLILLGKWMDVPESYSANVTLRLALDRLFALYYTGRQTELHGPSEIVWEGIERADWEMATAIDRLREMPIGSSLEVKPVPRQFRARERNRIRRLLHKLNMLEDVIIYQLWESIFLVRWVEGRSDIALDYRKPRAMRILQQKRTISIPDDAELLSLDTEEREE